MRLALSCIDSYTNYIMRNLLKCEIFIYVYINNTHKVFSKYSAIGLLCQ